jgi:signal transduction histidine kinase
MINYLRVETKKTTRKTSSPNPSRPMTRLLSVRTHLNTLRSTLSEALKDRIQQRILLAGTVIGILLILLITRNIRDTTQQIEGQAELELRSQSHALVINLRESLNLVDFTALNARREWQETGALRAHEAYVGNFPNFRDLILQLAIIGPNGYLKASSLPLAPLPVYLGDREHFKVHQQRQTDAIFISPLLTGRVSQQASIQFTRPILEADGSFGGVIVLSLNVDYLRQIVFERVLLKGQRAMLLSDTGQPRLTHVNGGPIAPEQLNLVDGRFDPRQDPDHSWYLSPVQDYPLQLAIGSASGATVQQLQHIRWFGWALAAIMLIALLAYLQHITRLVRQRNRLMAALDDSRRQAEAANTMKSRFVSSVSHELRTPLNGILGFAQLVDMSTSLAEAKESGQIIYKSAQHLNELVNTILDLSKIEAGQMELRLEQVSVHGLIEPAFALHRITAGQKNLQASLLIAPEVPATLTTDTTRFTQILNNLLNNAIKFTQSGSVRCIVNHLDGWWTITVEDTGIGMDAEQLSRLFDRFGNMHIDNPQAQAAQGAGLGMALTTELVTLLGGTLYVDSEKGRGTKVWLVLPDPPRPPGTKGPGKGP